MKALKTVRLYTAAALLMSGSMLSAPASAQDRCLIGEIRFFAGNFAPRGWAKAEGQLISIDQNQSLFAILGTMYGGDGHATFGLPDLRGRAAVGQGWGPGLSERNLGARIGSEKTYLPSHRIPKSDGEMMVAQGGKEVVLQPPALVITPIVCLVGYFPSRS